MHIRINQNIIILKTKTANSAGAIEYTNCISAEKIEPSSPK